LLLVYSSEGGQPRVKRKERRLRPEEGRSRGFGWSNLMEISSVLETI
jgi:hypothetical protein